LEKNIHVQIKLYIVYIGMLQVTRSNIGFYLYILIHIYWSIKTNQTDIYLLLLFTKYSFIAKGILLLNSIIFEVMPKYFVSQFNI